MHIYYHKSDINWQQHRKKEEKKVGVEMGIKEINLKGSNTFCVCVCVCVCV